MLPQYAKLYSIADAPTNPRPIEHHHVVVCAEENGGSDALLPVVQELRTRNVGVTALLAGEGAKAFQAKGSRYGLGVSEVSPWPPAATRPNALLYSASNDGRLEEYLSATFPDVNSVMIEDHYESSRYAVSRIHRRGLRVPTICGLDTEADRLIKERFKPLFPDLEIPVVVTGSPTFDVLDTEDTTAIGREMKEALGLGDQKLVAYLMPALGHTQLACAVAQACKDISQEVAFAVRRHPRDSVSDCRYRQVFEDMACIDTSAYTTEEIGRAADVVVTQRSTQSIWAAYRQKPNIAMRRFLAPEFTLPLVDAGVSLEAYPHELPVVIQELLEGTSQRCANLRANMAAYKVDGKAAFRVAEIVCQALVAYY